MAKGRIAVPKELWKLKHPRRATRAVQWLRDRLAEADEGREYTIATVGANEPIVLCDEAEIAIKTDRRGWRGDDCYWEWVGVKVQWRFGYTWAREQKPPLQQRRSYAFAGCGRDSAPYTLNIANLVKRIGEQAPAVARYTQFKQDRAESDRAYDALHAALHEAFGERVVEASQSYGFGKLPSIHVRVKTGAGPYVKATVHPGGDVCFTNVTVAFPGAALSGVSGLADFIDAVARLQDAAGDES